MKSVADYLHNLAPQTFPPSSGGTTNDCRGGIANGSLTDNVLRLVNPYAVRGRSPVLTAADYIHTASLDMLHCHDKRIPAVLRDFYKIALREKNRKACVEMGAILHLYVRSLNRLTFYKDAIQLGTGMMASTTSKFVPLDRGVRAVSISMHDVFNDIEWNRESATQTLDAASLSCENPYFRLFRVIFLEALIEYVGRDSTLFRQDEPDCEPTDVETVNSYLDIFAPSSSSSMDHSSDDDNVVESDEVIIETATQPSESTEKETTSTTVIDSPRSPTIADVTESSPPIVVVTTTDYTKALLSPSSLSPLQWIDQSSNDITAIEASTTVVDDTPLITATVSSPTTPSIAADGSDNEVNDFMKLIDELPRHDDYGEKEQSLDANRHQPIRRRAKRKRAPENAAAIANEGGGGNGKRRTRRKQRHDVDNNVTTWTPPTTNNDENEEEAITSWLGFEKSRDDNTAMFDMTMKKVLNSCGSCVVAR